MRKAFFRYPVIIAVLLFITAVSASLAASTPKEDEVVKLIESAAILAPGERVLVRVRVAEISVNAYINPSAQDVDNDCKIDAVLIARKIFSKYTSVVARVKVNFYERKRPNFARIINVTAGDVSSFASGNTTMAQLLASLEVRKETVKTPSITTATNGTPSPSAAVTLSSAGTSNDLVYYVQRDTGLRLAYPRGWKLEEKPASDVLASFSFGDEEGRYASVLLSANTKIPGARLEQYAQFVDQQYLHQLSGCQVHSAIPVKFGKAKDIQGLCQTLTFTMNGTKMKQEVYYFLDGEKLFSFRCTGSEAQFSVAKPWFNTILLSINAPTTGSERSIRSDPSKSTASNSDIYRSPVGHFSFRHPPGWDIKQYPEKDTLVKISGAGPKLQNGEFSLSVVENVPSADLVEMHANQVEEFLRKAVKDHRRTGRNRLYAGAGTNVDVVHDTYEFTYNNVPIIQHFAYMYSDGKIYALSFLAPGWTKEDARQLFDQALKTVSF